MTTSLPCVQLGHCKPELYQQQFISKKQRFLQAIKPLASNAVIAQGAFFQSPSEHFRNRIEFGLRWFDKQLHYVMFEATHKQPVAIASSNQVLPSIRQAMPILLAEMQQQPLLYQHCFQVNFRANIQGQLLISLIYRKPPIDAWHAVATTLYQQYGWNLIARFRKHKWLVGQDYLDYTLNLDSRYITLRQNDNTFSQPNPYINEQMLKTAIAFADSQSSDLLELYCGNAGFSIALSNQFQKILATEVVKSSLQLARYNCHTNRVKNIHLARLSAEETCQALSRHRPFQRLAHIDLDSLRLQSILVDPPRAGLATSNFPWLQSFQTILYFSCNLASLIRDLNTLTQTHHITKIALFDQFPYTHHLECAVLLNKL